MLRFRHFLAAAVILAAAFPLGLRSAFAEQQPPAPAAPQAVFNTQLSGAMPGVGNISRFEFTPNSQRLLTQVDMTAYDTADLVSIPVTGEAYADVSQLTVETQGVGDPFETITKWYELSPDGSRVVFVADRDTNDVRELYVAPTDGSSDPLRLNPAFPVGRYITGFKISPDSSRVLYVANQDNPAVTELYSVPISGGAAVKLSGSFAGAGNVVAAAGYLQFTGDSSRVVFLRVVNGKTEIFSAPVAGGTTHNLTGLVAANGNVQAGFKITPDNTAVIFRADKDQDEVYELYRASLTVSDSATELVTPSIASTEDIGLFQFTLDGTRVIFLGDLDIDNVNELYTVPMGGGSPTDLLGVMANNRSLTYFQVAASGNRIVFLAPLETDNKYELYSILDSGGAYTRISGDMNATGDVGMLDFSISPDGSRVVYRADAVNDGVMLLYSTAVASKSAVQLHLNPVAGGGVYSYKISPDSATVVFLSDHAINDQDDLYAAPILGMQTPVKLNPNNNMDVQGYYTISPDSGRVAFSYYNSGLQRSVLMTNTPSASQALTHSVDYAGGDVKSFQISRDNLAAVYLADQETDNVHELYRVNLNDIARIKLNAALPTGGDVLAYYLAPDSSRAAYIADQDNNDVFELYSTPLSSSSPVKLSGTLPVGGDVLLHPAPQITADSAVIVYAADGTADDAFHLYRASLAGGSAPTQLSFSAVAGADVQKFALSPNGIETVFMMDRDSDEVFELYVTATAGGGPITKLSGALASGGDVTDFAISPDGTRVVFRADKDAYDVFELYSVAITGGEVVRLHSPLPAGRAVQTDFAIAAHNNRVVFRADGSLSGQYDLYSALLTGGDVYQLSDALPAGGDVTAFAINSAGAQVVFRADGAVDEVYELYTVSIDGANRLRLSHGAGGASDVQPDFRLSGDGSLAYFRSDPLSDEVFNLYAVALTGTPPVLLNGALVTGGDVVDFNSSEDGSLVAYRADQTVNERYELFVVPGEGGVAAQAMSGSLSGNLDAGAGYAFTPAAHRLLYLGDVFTDSVVELYAANDTRSLNTISGFSLPANKYYSDSFTLNVFSSSSLPVTLRSASPNRCTVSGNVVTITGTGRCTIAAWQKGSVTFSSAVNLTAGAPYSARQYMPLILK